MSSIFNDKKYAQLDWLSQATEAYVTDLGVAFGQLPDSYETSYDDFVTRNGDVHTNLSSILERVILKDVEDYDIKRYLTDLYVFVADSPEVVLNCEEKRLIGGVKLIRNKAGLTDKELHDWITEKTMSALRNNLRLQEQTNEQRLRANEMLEMLGVTDKEHYATRSVSKKRSAIIDRYQQIMNEDLWKIRDQELSVRMAKHIAKFVETGNLASIATLCKLKIMTHNGLPIYSVEDVV